jgi:hypothetical protein
MPVLQAIFSGGVAFRIIISQYSMTRRSSGLFLVSMRAAFEELE